MRGEEKPRGNNKRERLEIPPHARRRVSLTLCSPLFIRNTSACAEKRGISTTIQERKRKYLRMRGEEMSSISMTLVALEIPPHARRRVSYGLINEAFKGNTSACAEKRPGSLPVLPYQWKYLRMRGEEMPAAGLVLMIPEIPPHARRRAAHIALAMLGAGNTSACAEKR